WSGKPRRSPSACGSGGCAALPGDRGRTCAASLLPRRPRHLREVWEEAPRLLHPRISLAEAPVRAWLPPGPWTGRRPRTNTRRRCRIRTGRRSFGNNLPLVRKRKGAIPRAWTQRFHFRANYRFRELGLPSDPRLTPFTLESVALTLHSLVFHSITVLSVAIVPRPGCGPCREIGLDARDQSAAI